jgi:hypothetical protein
MSWARWCVRIKVLSRVSMPPVWLWQTRLGRVQSARGRQSARTSHGALFAGRPYSETMGDCSGTLARSLSMMLLRALYPSRQANYLQARTTCGCDKIAPLDRPSQVHNAKAIKGHRL